MKKRMLICNESDRGSKFASDRKESRLHLGLIRKDELTKKSNLMTSGRTYWEKGTKYYEVAKLQNWKCPICGEPLINGEEVETHHIVPVAKGGSDDTDNLQHLHAICHKQVHSKSKLRGLK